MFSLQYAILSKIEASHRFFKDGRCREVYFEPFSVTGEAARENNLRFYRQPGFIHILARVDQTSGQPDPPLAGPLCLHFFLRVSDSLLGATAELEGTKKFYLSNLFPDFTVENPVLSRDSFLSGADACPRVFPNSFSIGIEPGAFNALTIRRYWPGGLVQAGSIPVGNEAENVEVRNLATGRYRLEWTRSDGSGIVEEEIFAGAEARDTANWLGIVEIFLTSALVADLSAPPVFSFSFNYKTKPWKFFLIDWKNRRPDISTDSIPALNIEYDIPDDSRLPAAVTFARIMPDALLPKDAQIRQALMQEALVREVYVLEAQSPIPFLDGDAPVLKLKKDATILIQELPVPSPDSPDASVFVNI